MATLPMTLSDL